MSTFEFEKGVSVNLCIVCLCGWGCLSGMQKLEYSNVALDYGESLYNTIQNNQTYLIGVCYNTV